ncbi:hypothetical protein HWV62_42516 [Athelia sp. TMB]|nr:hypothetical protein HWV62_42516 [Athelia sp. TMB]
MPPIDLEAGETEPLNGNGVEPPVPTKSIYAMTRSEITKGIANRFVHSRTYIFLYLGMAALSVTTVALSMSDGCPGLAFYILEIIVNAAMILEVGIRFVAFGRQFWKSPFNVFDLIVTVFCALTLLVLAFAGCGAASKEEEMLDTLLLIARNILQFGRLAAVMRQSGQSIFTQPKPIDLSAARRAGYNSLDLDLEYDEDDVERARGPILFDAQLETHLPPGEDVPFTDVPTSRHVADDSEVWRD